jgi:hypothetical protein
VEYVCRVVPERQRCPVIPPGRFLVRAKQNAIEGRRAFHAHRYRYLAAVRHREQTSIYWQVRCAIHAERLAALEGQLPLAPSHWSDLEGRHGECEANFLVT